MRLFFEHILHRQRETGQRVATIERITHDQRLERIWSQNFDSLGIRVHQPDELHATPILPIDAVRTAFYLRLRVADQKGVLAAITRILAEADISIDALLQRESAEGENQTDVIILTHDTIEGEMRAAIARMQALPTVLAPIVSLRKEELA